MKKLLSSRGETIVETLTSIALLALAMAILATMLTAAYRLGKSAEEEEERLSAALRSAELFTNIVGNRNITITSDSGSVSVGVEAYGEPNSSLRTYKK